MSKSKRKEREPVRITKTSCDRLVKGETIYDTEIRGFRAACLPSGRITFGYQYSSPTGKGRPYLALGLMGEITPDEARKLAGDAASAVRHGRDPVDEKQMEEARSTNTVRFVFNEWFTKYVPTAKDGKPLRSADAIKGIFERHIFPELGDIPVYDLVKTAKTTGSVTDMLDKVKDSGGSKGGIVMANRVYTWLQTVLEWWRDRDDKFVTQPMPSSKPGGKEKSRDRFLPWDEIADFWRATDELEEPSKQYWKTVLLCGGRRNEVANMHTRELEGDNWVIPSERYKTDVDHIIPLTPSLKAVLPKLPKDGYVFSTTKGEVPISGFSKMKATLDKKINALRKREGRTAMKSWQIRDLRRSCRTLMVALGINEYHAKAVTGHKMKGIDGVYNVWGYLPEKAAAIEKFAEHIKSLLPPPTTPESSARGTAERTFGGECQPPHGRGDRWRDP